GQIASGAAETSDQSQGDRITSHLKDYWNRRGRRLGCQCGWGCAGRRNHADLTANQIGSERRQAIEAFVGPAVLDHHVAALNKAIFGEPLPECSYEMRRRGSRPGAEIPDHRQRRPLLRPRRERPRCRRGAEEGEEGAAVHGVPHHSITSSAATCSVSGTVRPSALAVFMLITNSNFTGCCTGRSAGFSPLRMRST